jgi:thioredoxin-related protein
MKIRILSILAAAIAVCAVNATAGGVTFTSVTSWQQALDLAKAQNKYLFVDAYTDWCGWCKVMDKKTFTDEGVASIMNSKFVNVKIEMETGYGIDLAIKYRVSSFPQFLVLSPNGDLVYRMSGYAPPADFIPELNKALDPATQQSYPGITRTFPLDAPKILRDACGKGDARTFAAAAEVSAWLDTQKDPESEVAWSVMSRLQLEPKWEQWISDHRTSLGKKYGSEEVNNVLVRGISRKADAAIKAKDRDKLEDVLKTIPEDLSYRDRMSAMYRLTYFRAVQDWALLVDVLKVDLERGVIDGSVVNEFSWSMYEDCTDNAALYKASTLMGSILANAGYAEWDTYAALLFKTNQLGDAEKAAIKAIDLGKAEGAKVGETEALLKRIQAAKQ